MQQHDSVLYQPKYAFTLNEANRFHTHWWIHKLTCITKKVHRDSWVGEKRRKRRMRSQIYNRKETCLSCFFFFKVPAGEQVSSGHFSLLCIISSLSLLFILLRCIQPAVILFLPGSLSFTQKSIRWAGIHSSTECVNLSTFLSKHVLICFSFFYHVRILQQHDPLKTFKNKLWSYDGATKHLEDELAFSTPISAMSCPEPWISILNF